MTYEEALKMIQIHSEYHDYLGVRFRRKIIPKNIADYSNYLNDLTKIRIKLSNEDAKNYSRNNDFAVISFPLWLLDEE